MQPRRFTRNVPRTLVTVFVIAAGSAFLALVGCTMVGDRVTGVSLERGRPTTCILQCNHLYRALFDQERKRHIANVEVCRSLARTEMGACLEAEGARHAAEMDRLSRALTDCQSSCHDAGEGSAG